MAIPTNIKKLTEAAFNAMMRHEFGALIPYWRKTIYDAIDEGGETWLALLGAWKILPLLHNEEKSFILSENLLVLAEGVLRKYIDKKVAVQLAASLTKLQKLGFDKFNPAALEAVRMSVGENHFFVGCIMGEVHALDENYPEYEHWYQDEYFVDTAELAVITFAHIPGMAELDLDKSREYWTWWLKEAVPQAWLMAQKLPEITNRDVDRYLKAQKEIEQVLNVTDAEGVSQGISDDPGLSLDYDTLNVEPEDEANFRRLFELDQLLVREEIAETEYVTCNNSDYDDFSLDDLPEFDPWWS